MELIGTYKKVGFGRLRQSLNPKPFRQGGVHAEGWRPESVQGYRSRAARSLEGARGSFFKGVNGLGFRVNSWHSSG